MMRSVRVLGLLGVLVGMLVIAACAPSAGGGQAQSGASKPAAQPAQPAAGQPAAPAQQKQQPAAQQPAQQAQIKWRAAFFGPPREASAGDEWLAKEVAARTNGRMQIEIAYGETLAKATEIPDGLKAGAYEIGWFCASYYPGKLPLFSLLDSAFFVPENLEAQAKLQLAMFEHPAIVDELKKWNAKALRPNVLPSYGMMGKKRIAKVEDLKGVRIRVSGEMARPLEEFGAVKSLVPAPEVYTALDKGVIDMATFPWTYSFSTYKLHEISKYAIKTDLGSQPCFRAVNLDAWNKLTPDLQKLLTELAAESAKYDIQAYKQADEKNYPLWRQVGIEIIDPFPAAERAKLVAVAAKHWQGWVEDKQKKGLPGQQVFDFAVAKIKELTGKSPLEQ